MPSCQPERILISSSPSCDILSIYDLLFLYHTISTRFFSPALLPPLLLQIRAVLFPNNSIGPPAPPPPSPEEARGIRSKAASDLLSLTPKSVARNFLTPAGAHIAAGTVDGEMRREIEDRLLGWMDDAAMNKFLVYAILEHVVVRLIPEMVDKTPSELLADRGVSLTEESPEQDQRHGHDLDTILDLQVGSSLDTKSETQQPTTNGHERE
ncbi:hypothetical protein ABEF95_014208 [Exophiala dermatitidis]